jgi:murein DD-endopeptidase MepM/ murein hydrolase activator NlpD
MPFGLRLPPLEQTVLLLFLSLVAGGGLAFASVRDSSGSEGGPSGAEFVLPAAAAAGIQIDTLFLGGYTSGDFSAAVAEISSDLSMAERELVGQHLDRIFERALNGEGVGRSGRLRVAYERAIRPDGTTRSIRVLGAEVGSGGRVYRAFYFERDGRPGYFDASGRAVDESSWTGPLARLRVTSPFALRRLHPILRTVLPHTGVDFAGRIGDPVYATADGLVASAGTRGGYGLLVEVQHPSGYSTRYAHLSGLAPGVGPQRMVRQGQVIGYVGMSGTATGPHLHYEVRRRGQPLDPTRVNAGPSGDIAGEPRWANERGDLFALLARTPIHVRAPS